MGREERSSGSWPHTVSYGDATRCATGRQGVDYVNIEKASTSVPVSSRPLRPTFPSGSNLHLQMRQKELVVAAFTPSTNNFNAEEGATNSPRSWRDSSPMWRGVFRFFFFFYTSTYLAHYALKWQRKRPLTFDLIAICWGFFTWRARLCVCVYVVCVVSLFASSSSYVILFFYVIHYI